MRTDRIAAIGIDESGSLWQRPGNEKFPFIYREAMEVHWDTVRNCLYSPVPRGWSYSDWYRQIVAAAREQGVILVQDNLTEWNGPIEELRSSIAV